MIAAGADTWLDILALIIVGVVVIVCAWLGSEFAARRSDKRGDARTRRSVELHREAFDGTVEELEHRLVRHVTDALVPIVERQQRQTDTMDAIGKDVRGMRQDIGELRGSDRDHHIRLAALERGRSA